MRTATLGVLLLISFPSLIPCKFVEESCNAYDDACPSLLAYLLPHDSKLAEIASRFQVNLTAVVGANAFDAAKSFSGNEILSQNTLLRIPISCPCANGIRQSLSTTYTVKPFDTLDSVAAEFSGLVSGEQIQTANGMWGSGGLQIGRSLVIPLSCACFKNSDDGVAAIYMSYVVRQGDSLKSIGQVYGTTVSDLVAVNELGTAFVYPGDILAIPLPACSSSYLHLQYSENLLVPNGSYALTALNCVQCICGPNDLTLRCHPAPLAMSCSNFKCDSSNLSIGDSYVQPTSSGCNVISCLYHGHKGHTILNGLRNFSQIQCSGAGPAGRQHSLPPSSLPSINQSIFPLDPLSAPPKPAATLPLSTISSGGNSIQDSGTSPPAEAPKSAFCLSILLVELILAVCLKAI